MGACARGAYALRGCVYVKHVKERQRISPLRFFKFSGANFLNNLRHRQVIQQVPQ